ncbi:hypothetical protein CAEBREN_25786 [Caenorhabditis brenneri]|uniref:F-box domain-containing protein n=1 Tax=Caenorhabditis brenneri TaxID=135651 RepID=G0PKT7_CAEBE|nr:hypothetical protein CAEBREN_25786 [Caenorhabditis brenneri]
MVLPILKLPFLVIQNVLESMGFIELFVFTRSSRRMKWIVKNRIRIPKHRTIMVFDKPLVVKIHNRNMVEWFSADAIYELEYSSEYNFYQNIGKANDVVSEYFDLESLIPELSTYWNDKMVGFKELFGELRDIFQISIETLEILKMEQYYEPILKWTSELNIEKVEMNGVKLDLRLLQFMNAPTIEIDNSSFSDVEINIFLLNLKNHGSNPNLEVLCIFFYRQSRLDIVLDELGAIQEVLDDEITWNFPLATGEKCTIGYYQYEDPQPDRDCFGFEIRVARRGS